MEFKDAIVALNSLENYERMSDFRLTGNNLERMRKLAEVMDKPQDKFRSLHIAGTKGKGSTSVMTASILTGSGYKTGLYTSPHLTDIRERIKIDGEMISPEQFASSWKKVERAIYEIKNENSDFHVTYFEALTALAFDFFASEGVEFAVLEVGLGGRFDATNIVTPEVTAITQIGLEHVNILGPTLDLIATEKAGIIKSNVPLIIGRQREDVVNILVQKAKDMNVPSYRIGKHIEIELEQGGAFKDIVGVDKVASPRARFSVKTWDRVYDGLQLPFFGEHQRDNVAVAIGILEILRERSTVSVEVEDVRHALKKVYWPGRFEILPGNPRVILDVAHDPLSARALAKTLQEHFSPQRTVVLFSSMADKDMCTILKELLPVMDILVMTEAASPRVASVSMAEKFFVDRDSLTVFSEPDVSRAYLKAVELAGPDGRLLITGSFALIGAIKSILS